ncbi:MAG TPA: hypothetical protein DCS09_05450 [Porphyromonadaceae bacterium]|nr:hypothetical protein [Porphyromonadaceae bacterium]
MQIITNQLRNKYARRGDFTPAGSRDVRDLCDCVDRLIRVIEMVSLRFHGEDKFLAEIRKSVFLALERDSEG